jgi:hypothetical protein
MLHAMKKEIYLKIEWIIELIKKQEQGEKKLHLGSRC